MGFGLNYEIHMIQNNLQNLTDNIVWLEYTLFKLMKTILKERTGYTKY